MDAAANTISSVVSAWAHMGTAALSTSAMTSAASFWIFMDFLLYILIFREKAAIIFLIWCAKEADSGFLPYR